MGPSKNVQFPSREEAIENKLPTGFHEFTLVFWGVFLRRDHHLLNEKNLKGLWIHQALNLISFTDEN